MSQLGIHTICFAPGMVDAVDPAFLPFDVTADPQTDRRETAHMLNFWRQGLHKKFAVSALLSPRFAYKTGFSGRLFTDYIVNNPGYDAWIVNPFPHLFYLSYNMWENGEFWIPGLCDLAARVFAEANVGFDPRKAPRSTKATLLYCNFWAGTPGFWDQFMPFVDHIATHAAKVGGMTDKVFYLGRDACYWPFLFECLFTTFLTLNPGIRVHHINYDTSQVAGMNLSPIPKLLLREWAPMVDRWDAVGRHSDDQRAIFRGMQKLCALELLRAHPDLLKIALDL